MATSARLVENQRPVAGTQMSDHGDKNELCHPIDLIATIEPEHRSCIRARPVLERISLARTA
jgi:hypothetical protein